MTTATRLQFDRRATFIRLPRDRANYVRQTGHISRRQKSHGSRAVVELQSRRNCNRCFSFLVLASHTAMVSEQGLEH